MPGVFLHWIIEKCGGKCWLWLRKIYFRLFYHVEQRKYGCSFIICLIFAILQGIPSKRNSEERGCWIRRLRLTWVLAISSVSLNVCPAIPTKKVITAILFIFSPNYQYIIILTTAESGTFVIDPQPRKNNPALNISKNRNQEFGLKILTQRK